MRLSFQLLEGMRRLKTHASIEDIGLELSLKHDKARPTKAKHILDSCRLGRDVGSRFAESEACGLLSKSLACAIYGK
jgi:hypothetical protein